MATAKFDIKTVQTNAVKPFYVYVGATDLAVEALRDAFADLQKRLGDVQADVVKLTDVEPAALRTQAEKVAKARREAIEKGIADLVKRGEDLVGRIRNQESTKEVVKEAKTTVAKAKTTRTQATKATKTASTAATKTVKANTKTATTSAKTAAKKATTTAKKSATPVKKQAATAASSAKATATAATKTAASAAQAVVDAAEKIGD